MASDLSDLETLNSDYMSSEGNDEGYENEDAEAANNENEAGEEELLLNTAVLQKNARGS